MGCRAFRWLVLGLGLCGCEHDLGPCWWDAHQDRESGMIQAQSLECDGVVQDPAFVRVRYNAATTPLSVEVAAPTFSPMLAFDSELADGTYSVETPAVETPLSEQGPVTASGALVTGTFTFGRSRDIPFVDLDQPTAKDYSSTIDITLDLVAVLPHPDPAMGAGCKLVTGEQHVSVLVSGPVKECSSGVRTGAH
jgi:hypothetical protein